MNIQAASVKPKWGRIVLISFIALVLSSILIALGTWQIQRLSWKHDLMARVEQNIHAEPISAPTRNEWQQSDQKALEYRVVTVQGHYLNDKETPIAALTEKGSGYWIVTPFQRDNGEVLFINRGFVGPENRDLATRASGQIAGETNVTGLIRLTEPKGFFLRQNDPDHNIWHARDIDVLSERLGLKNVPDYFIDANSDQNREDRPTGGLTVVKFADNHLAYALTWFALTIMVLGMAGYLIYYELRGKHHRE